MVRIAMIVWAFALGAGGLAQAWEPSQQAVASVEAGNVWLDIAPANDGASRVRGVVDIAAPPAVVWRTLRDCKAAPKMVPNLKTCRVLETDPQGRWDVREHVSKAGLLPSVRTVFRSEYEAPHVLTFQRVDGDMKIANGGWRLEPLDGGKRTRAIYENLLKPGFPAPSGILRSVLRSEAPKGLAGLRKAAETAARQD